MTTSHLPLTLKTDGGLVFLVGLGVLVDHLYFVLRSNVLYDKLPQAGVGENTRTPDKRLAFLEALPSNWVENVARYLPLASTVYFFQGLDVELKLIQLSTHLLTTFAFVRLDSQLGRRCWPKRSCTRMAVDSYWSLLLGDLHVALSVDK